MLLAQRRTFIPLLLLPTCAFSWTAPVNLGSTVNSAYNDYNPSLGAYSGTTYLFFATQRPGGVGYFDIWYATGTPPNFGSPIHTGSLINTAAYEAGPCICWTGGPITNTLYYYSSRAGGPGGGNDIYQSVYTGGSWGTPVGVGANVNSADHESYPYIASWLGETRLYFVRNGSVYYSTYSGGQWGPPAPVALGSGDAYHPCIRGEGAGAKLYFSSTRAGGLGDYDIWVSTFGGGVWGQPVNLGSAVNTAYGDACPWFAPDGQTMYFASDRPGGQGQYDLWYTVLDNPGVEPSSIGRMKAGYSQ